MPPCAAKDVVSGTSPNPSDNEESICKSVVEFTEDMASVSCGAPASQLMYLSEAVALGNNDADGTSRNERQEKEFEDMAIEEFSPVTECEFSLLSDSKLWAFQLCPSDPTA
eukprot:GDKK01030015.1.p2 GENE.GDKK01030015.1~~GDKK01030015.1.p2  ORF type:complete len:111 (+),score=13.61 GDKK01030015.1:310-642(+)